MHILLLLAPYGLYLVRKDQASVHARDITQWWLVYRVTKRPQ